MTNRNRFISGLVAVVLTGALSACHNSAAGSAEQASSAENETESAMQNDSQTAEAESAAAQPQQETAGTLVIYFSRTGEQYQVGKIEKGNTAIVAEMIIETTGADSFEILPEEDYYPYTYEELTDIAKREQSQNARPAYAGEIPDLSKYSTIFIGSPVWWGDWPMIMYTFFENNENALAGKTLIPFSTHAGSGLSGFDRKLASSCPNSIIGDGLAVAGQDAQNNKESVQKTVNDWLFNLGYK